MADAIGTIIEGWAGIVVKIPTTVPINTIMEKLVPSAPGSKGTTSKSDVAINFPKPECVATAPKPMTPPRTTQDRNPSLYLEFLEVANLTSGASI